VRSLSDADIVMTDELPDGMELSGLTPMVLVSSGASLLNGLRAGARAVISAYATPDQILAAIHAAAAGLVAMSVEDAIAMLPTVTARLNEPLTPRELEVLDMLAEGLSNKVIAHKLAISEHTAKFHVNSILAKFNAGTRTEAVTRGIRLGLIKI